MLAIAFEDKFKASAIKFIHQGVDIATTNIDGREIAEMLDPAEIVGHMEAQIAATMHVNHVLHPFDCVGELFVVAETSSYIKDVCIMWYFFKEVTVEKLGGLFVTAAR